MPRILAVLSLVLLAVAGVACGDERAAREAPERVTLALDFTANPVHAPAFAAVREGHDRRAGISLEIRKPGAGPDALKLAAAGKVDLAFLDIHDLAIARERGSDVVAVGVVIDRPLAALVARSGIDRPAELEGHTVGVSGLPSDPAFLRAIVESDGGDADRVRQVTIGFTAVTRLLSGRVDAVPVFWNVEGVLLRRRGFEFSEFRVEDYGAPPYPEVVLITSRRTLERRREALRRALSALRDGVRTVRADPAAAAEQVAQEAETPRQVPLVRAQLDAVLPVFSSTLEPDRAVLEQWADFDARIGIVRRRPDVEAAFARP